MQTRRDTLAAAFALAAAPGAAGAQGSAAALRAWDFLVGSWAVHHRKLRQRLAGSNAWDEFSGTLVNWPLMGAAGNVGDNVFEMPSGVRRGIGLRAFDAATQTWCSWWLPEGATEIAPPVRGGFSDGVGVFLSDDTFDGRPIKVRVRWLGVAANAPRWEQAFSADGGATWEINWVSDFARRA
jgi:hypothetical protein